MAEWSKNKVDPKNLHGGQEFVKDDNLAVDELNAIVNNSFYASGKSERAEQLAESAVKGNGTLVTIGGVIQGEWSADFAESERQKSKNLVYINGHKRSSTAGVDYVFDGENQALLIHGTTTAIGSLGSHGIEVNIGKLKANTTYTITIYHERGSVSLSGYSVLYFSFDGIGNQTMILDGNTKSITFTPTADTYLSSITLDMASNNNYNDVVYRFQIEEGEVATEWQYPYGAIVHKEDIADVEHYEKFYSVLDGKTTINNEDFGSGLPISTNIISDTFSKYKALIIKSKRNEQLLVSRLEVVEDYLNYSSGIMLNNNGGYLIIHNFSYNKNYKSFNFIGGGYCYIDGVSETKFNSESSESNNLIYEIVGVLK